MNELLGLSCLALVTKARQPKAIIANKPQIEPSRYKNVSTATAGGKGKYPRLAKESKAMNFRNVVDPNHCMVLALEKKNGLPNFLEIATEA